MYWHATLNIWLGNARRKCISVWSHFLQLAVVLAGLAEVPFFIAIYVFYSQYSPKWLLLIGLLAGLTNGLAIFMTGVNPLHLTGDIGAHVTWSYIIFFSLI